MFHSKGPFQDICRQNRRPKLFVKLIIIQAVEKVFLHTSDSPFLSNELFGFPFSKKPYGFFKAVSSQNRFGLLETTRPIELFDFHSHIANLVGHAALPFDERVELFDSFQQGVSSSYNRFSMSDLMSLFTAEPILFQIISCRFSTTSSTMPSCGSLRAFKGCYRLSSFSS